MTQRTFSLVTAVLFSLVALLHALRLLRGWQVTIEGAVMPVWISWIGLAIAAYLAYQGFLLSNGNRYQDFSPEEVCRRQISGRDKLCLQHTTANGPLQRTTTLDNPRPYASLKSQPLPSAPRAGL